MWINVPSLRESLADADLYEFRQSQGKRYELQSVLLLFMCCDDEWGAIRAGDRGLVFAIRQPVAEMAGDQKRKRPEHGDDYQDLSRS